MGSMRLRSSGSTDDTVNLEKKAMVVKIETEPLPFPRQQAPCSRNKMDEKFISVKREIIETDEKNAMPIVKKKAKRANIKTKRIPRQEPDGWKEILLGIEEMRVNKNAEVDKYGEV